MAIVRLQDTELTDIGNSIRAKLGVATQYLPEEMAPAILTIPKEKVFEWGSETEAGAGTAQWWADLKDWIRNKATIADLAGCVGKQKSITLTAPVLGTTTHLVRCVGYNCNRDRYNVGFNTLTFETTNGLSQYVAFNALRGTGDAVGNPLWKDSDVRKECLKYYDAFPGKNSIAHIKTRTATGLPANGVQNDPSVPIEISDETVFIASDGEHAVPPGNDLATDTGHAVSYNEFDVNNTSKTPFQYYAVNTRENKIKYRGDTTTTGQYWERSISLSASNKLEYACLISRQGRPNGLHAYYGTACVVPAFVI